MLSKQRKAKLQAAIKQYYKSYLSGKITDLDESGTRILINSFLTEVLGYHPLEEVKTEYNIKGTYADYVIQIAGNRPFLVEVKAFSLNLSEKHLRQAINYGANEGIEWALLTNGKNFEFYKILFNKPIESHMVISVDLTDETQLKTAADTLEHFHRESVISGGLPVLWNKFCALVVTNIAGYLLSSHTVSYVRRNLKIKFKCKLTDAEVKLGIGRVIAEKINLEDVIQIKEKNKRKQSPLKIELPIVEERPSEIPEPAQTVTTN